MTCKRILKLPVKLFFSFPLPLVISHFDCRKAVTLNGQRK